MSAATGGLDDGHIAAGQGADDSEVIEEAVRRYLGLDLLDRLWSRNNLSDEQALDVAVEAQHATRRP